MGSVADQETRRPGAACAAWSSREVTFKAPRSCGCRRCSRLAGQPDSGQQRRQTAAVLLLADKLFPQDVGSGGDRMSSVGRDGGQPAISLGGSAPARPRGPPDDATAQQGQVGQVGRTTVQPGRRWVGFTPGQRPLQPGKKQPPYGRPAARWAAQTTRLVRRLQRLGRRPTQDQGATAPSRPAAAPPTPSTLLGACSPVLGRRTAVVEMTVAAGLAGDQHPCQGTITGSRR